MQCDKNIFAIKRIAIIGNAGSGKSTLARELGEMFGLPVYHLDQYFWKPGWVYPNPEEYRAVHEQLCAQDVWIMDGMNLRLLEHRVERADVVIFLDLPRYICFWRIIRRMMTYYGKETPSSAPGCTEELGWRIFPFFLWVWRFKKRYPARIAEILALYANTKEIYHLRSVEEISCFIETFNEKITLNKRDCV